jgi:hypothetical protein
MPAVIIKKPGDVSVICYICKRTLDVTEVNYSAKSQTPGTLGATTGPQTICADCVRKYRPLTNER